MRDNVAIAISAAALPAPKSLSCPRAVREARLFSIDEHDCPAFIMKVNFFAIDGGSAGVSSAALLGARKLMSTSAR